MSNPDGILSLSLRLGATLCANGLTVAARVADPLLNMFGPIDRRANRFLTLDGCDHADRLNAAEEKVDVLDPFWSDGGPTEWLGVAPSGQPTDFDGPVGEYLDPRLLADDPAFGLLGPLEALRSDPAEYLQRTRREPPQSSAPGILRQQQPVERDAPQEVASTPLDATPAGSQTPIGGEQPVSVGVTGPGADGSLSIAEAFGLLDQKWAARVPPATSADKSTSVLMAAAANQLIVLKGLLPTNSTSREYLNELIIDLDMRADQHADIGD